MVRESIAVLLVGVILMVVFVRSKHYGYALGSAPVFIIPLLHLIMRGVLYVSKERFFGVRPAVAMAFTDVLALGITCAFVVFISHRIQSKRNRRLYLVLLLVYSILLGWGYLYDSLRIILA